MKIFLEIALAFVIVDVIIVAYVVYRRYNRKISREKIEKIKESWRQIIRQQDRRHAIMDADNLLDHSLSLFGYKGNLGVKLKRSPKLFSNINQIWAAHKVRNNIAHQINYEVSEQAYKAAMLAFKQAFKDLKIF